MHYVGMDIHKRTIQVALKRTDGTLVENRKIDANRTSLHQWACTIPRPFSVVMEATLFTGWVYDQMIQYADCVKVANPQVLFYISKGKKKSDKLDAAKLADLLRVDLIPEVCMLPPQARRLRELLRYRHWLVRQGTRYKNKITGHLMAHGVSYDSRKIHGKRYFQRFLSQLEADASLLKILGFSRQQLDIIRYLERQVLKLLHGDESTANRIALLTSIPGVGEITALTWALEVWDPHRFPNARRAISYCGLCSAYRESAGKERRSPLSKQRNKYLQWVLVEATKLAVHRRMVPDLVRIYEKTAQSKNRNAATIAAARHLVKWLLAVDKRNRAFVESTGGDLLDIQRVASGISEEVAGH